MARTFAEIAAANLKFLRGAGVSELPLCILKSFFAFKSLSPFSNGLRNARCAELCAAVMPVAGIYDPPPAESRFASVLRNQIYDDFSLFIWAKFP